MKRQPDRESANHDRPWKNHRRPIRLVLEPLEARRLLAGLNVAVFVDQDGSRSVDVADTAATRRVVFLDLNNNGQQDSTDPVAFTNERGIATFEDIVAGDYAVGIAAGNSLQSQAFPIRVEELATRIGPSASALIAADDLSQVWAFDGAGRGQLISAATSALKIQLDGAIISSVNMGAEAWVITHSDRGPSGTKLTQFNLGSGRQASAEIRGLNGRVVEKLIKSGTDVVAQLNGPSGIELAKLSIGSTGPNLGVSVAFPNLVTVSGAGNQLAVLEYRSDFAFANPTIQMRPLATKLSVLDLNDFSIQATTFLPQSASEVAMSTDGRLVLAAFSTGGVMVLNNDAHLSAAATLAEASGPLLVQSKDGRLVTGNSSNAFEFIVWDVNSWQPSGRTRVTASAPTTMAATAAISQAILANTGDRLIATGANGTVTSQLAQATTAAVAVPADGVASVQLGVRVNGENSVPSNAPISTTLLEDNATSGQLRSQVADADHDTLWFSVISSPSHGRLRVTPSGEWSFQPSDNFNGTDRAVVRVFDGQTSSDIALVLNVSPINDPPEALRVEVLTIAENMNSEAVEGLGYVTVVDVDLGSHYQFESSDHRFQVRNGRIYLVAGTKLDFETEPTIKLEIIATEDAVSGYQISTTATLSIADVNEPPTAVRILNASVPENTRGAIVGPLQVDDPDRTNRFEYVLSDSRFMVENSYLKLKPGVELDFEEANSINLSVTVSDTSGQSVTEPIRLTVADRNDAPTSIDLHLKAVEEATPGAVVGTIAVNDQDGQAYQYTVSDARFEVVDGELRLKEGQTVDKSADRDLKLTVIATSVVGSDAIASTMSVSVVAKKSPYQNPTQPRDVNGDGQVTPLDALILINYMNSFGPGPLGGNSPLGGSGEGPVWVDVNGDGIISPLDILIIINWLNRQRLLAETTPRAEGEGSPLQASTASTSPTVSRPGSRITSPMVSAGELACPAIKARTDSEIDLELENLLDALTRERLGFLGS